MERNKGQPIEEISIDELKNYIGWINSLSTPSDFLKREKITIENYLRLKTLETEVEPPKFDANEEIPF
jgi:hypothetical protein